MKPCSEIFALTGRVCIVTGGAGLLGVRHAQAILAAGGIAVLLDIDEEAIAREVESLKTQFSCDILGIPLDITNEDSLLVARSKILNRFGRIDALINNAAINPTPTIGTNWSSRLEGYSLQAWNQEIAVGLTGAFLCSRVFGASMASRNSGVILNISSDLGLIAPDQRIYRKANLDDNMQPVKPVTYSIIKHGLIGLTRYLATYWSGNGIRVNALCPGGVENNQPADFIERLTSLIPLGRMADKDEYMGAIIFLLSDASSYMTGSVISIDGGRTCW